MSSRILRAVRWPIAVAIVIGATQLPATAQIRDPICPAQIAAEVAPAAVSPELTHTMPPVYEIAALRAQIFWSPSSRN